MEFLLITLGCSVSTQKTCIFFRALKRWKLWGISHYTYITQGVLDVYSFLTWPNTEVKTSAKHDRCGMKLCQSCQEFFYGENFFPETSPLPTALLDALLVIISGQWAAIFRRFCNNGKRSSSSHPAEASATQGLYFDPACQPTALLRGESAGEQWWEHDLALRNSRFICVRWCFPRQDTEINNCVLEQSVERIERDGEQLGRIICFLI